MQLTRCRICGKPCLAGVGLCSRCAQRIRRDILIGMAIAIAVFVCAVVYILTEFYK